MKVLKFGGGCLKDAESIKQLPKILENYKDEHVLLVISAFGKMTNMLEKKNYDDFQYFASSIMFDLGFSNPEIERIFNKHINTIKTETLNYPSRVCIGEYIASDIIHFYLKNEEINNVLLDAAFRIKTDSWFDESNSAVFDFVKLFDDDIHFLSTNIKITQGFIASSINYTISKPTNFIERTTLGREGSDYSAAIFGVAFGASEVILFKDVDGMYSSDPKKNSDAKLFSKLTYDEAFKLCDNGNTIVHPKTVHHLKEKKIPLLIKNFYDLTQPGTIIN